MSLTDTHPELFNNPTLGAATTNAFLDEVEAQNKEDRSARIAGRDPRTIVAVNRYPHYMPSGSVPSNVQDQVVYLDEVDTDDNGAPIVEDAPPAITYSKKPEEPINEDEDEDEDNDPYAGYSEENN